MVRQFFFGLAKGSCALATIALAGAPAHALAEEKGSFLDYVEQAISTFTGDPAANVDFDLKHVLDRWRSLHPKPLEELSPADARRQPTPIEAAADLMKDRHKTLDTYSIETKDVTYPGPDGTSHGARIYTPAGAAGKGSPVVVFYHGGGFVIDSEPSTNASARAIAGAGGFIVVAPDYRLAPEHKFPAAQQDSLAAYKWVLANAASFGGDPAKVALAGEGAGGLLAADTAIAARGQHLPKAAALVLIAPAAGIDLKTNSWLEDSAARPWNDKAVRWALDLYLPTPDAIHDPQIDLVGEANVAGLPPTTIVTAEIDPLRSDGERFGGKLKRATVPVSMRDYSGMTHDFFGMGAAVEKAAIAQQFVADQLKAAFAPKANATVALEDMGVAPYPQAPDPVAPPVAATMPKVAPQAVQKMQADH